MSEITMTTIASDGKEITLSNKPVPFTGLYYGGPVPLMERDESRANTTIWTSGFRLSYDSLGYCWERVRDESHGEAEA